MNFFDATRRKKSASELKDIFARIDTAIEDSDSPLKDMPQSEVMTMANHEIKANRKRQEKNL